jgi:hypothetical protein
MQRIFLVVLSLLIQPYLEAQPIENIIFVTTDGFRWQEMFTGMDSAIANNKKFNEGDSAKIYANYWAPTAQERRSRLMPFVWNTIGQQGQMYGNRHKGSLVNVANPHWFSYPGYSEMMTGFADTAINSNSYPPNPHVTVLEYFHQQPAFKGKVAAFGAWEAFNRILNEQRSGINVVAAFDTSGGANPNSQQLLINRMLRDSYKPWGEGECLDVFTHHAAMEELKKSQPRILYIAYGETDEWAHAGKYRSYLDAAHQVDAWIKELWDYVQSNPQYKNKTALLITTDHGRGDTIKEQWTDHGSKIEGANEIWLAVMAPGIKPMGEAGAHGMLYQQQIAQTIARLLGQKFTANHPVAESISPVFDK